MLSSVWPTHMSLQNANFQTCARTCDSQRVFQLCFSFTFVGEHMLHMVFLFQNLLISFLFDEIFPGIRLESGCKFRRCTAQEDERAST